MTDAIKAFDFEQKEVRVITKDGEPWFVAADVCAVLDIQNVTQAVQRLEEDEHSMSDIGCNGGPARNIINESGLYALILRSDKPEAKAFRKWVTGTVLPSIRKHDVYMTPQAMEEALTNPDFIINLARRLKDEQTRNAALTQKTEALEAKVEADRPKVLFADSVAASDMSILIGNLAKLLRQNGVNMGQNRLFKWMREKGYLMKTKGDGYNMPTQKSMERGLFEVKERVVNNPDGTVFLTKTPKVTGKGQEYFVALFLSGKATKKDKAA